MLPLKNKFYKVKERVCWEIFYVNNCTYNTSFTYKRETQHLTHCCNILRMLAFVFITTT